VAQASQGKREEVHVYIHKVWVVQNSRTGAADIFGWCAWKDTLLNVRALLSGWMALGRQLFSLSASSGDRETDTQDPLSKGWGEVES
jgi:hypothetical protein